LGEDKTGWSACVWRDFVIWRGGGGKSPGKKTHFPGGGPSKKGRKVRKPREDKPTLFGGKVSGGKKTPTTEKNHPTVTEKDTAAE